MPPKRKMNTKTQKVAKTISFYMKKFHRVLMSFLIFEKLQRKRLADQDPTDPALSLVRGE